jgi:hypothetical protein
MVLDCKNNKLKENDKVLNTDTNKIFVLKKEHLLVLNHSEIIYWNDKKVWKYNHLLKL